MVDPYDYWCKESTPQDLKDALIGGDQERLRTWCKQNPESLASALECIHPQHTVYRNIVKNELSIHQEKEARETAEARHQQLVNWAKIGVATMITGVVIAIIVGVAQCR